MRSPMMGPSVKDQITLYVFVSVLFVVGVVFGALLVNALTLEQQEELTGDVRQFAQHMLAGMPQQDGTEAFWDRVWFHAKWLLLIWVLGLTVVGMPLVLALDFLKGVLVGFAVGTLISQQAWKGLLFSLVSVAPGNLILVPALLTASVSAVSFSIYMVRNRLFSRYGTLKQPFLTHTTTAVGMMLVAVLAAMFEAFVSPALLKWAAPLILSS